jgi:RHS repeat-associated protein
MYDEKGQAVWETHLDIYGKVRTFAGRSLSDCPFRYQGQYEDSETGLYYNRFRYYSPEEGMYLSQDPIGLAGNNPTLYGYVKDVNSWVDVFGLDCSSDAAKLRKNMQAADIVEPGYDNSAHHIVMSNSIDSRMVKLRTQMEHLGINKNDAVNGVYLPTSSKVKKDAGAVAHAHSKVHTETYMQNVYDRLKDINNKIDFENTLMNIGDELSAGTFNV